MTDQAQILPGTLELLILKAVSLGPLHGNGILLRIQQISGQALLQVNWGTSENKRRAKFYEIKSTGRERFWEESNEWGCFATAMTFALTA